MHKPIAFHIIDTTSMPAMGWVEFPVRLRTGHAQSKGVPLFDAMDPALEAYAAAHPALPELSVAAYRERVAAGVMRMTLPDPGDMLVEDLTIDGPEGTPLALRIFRRPPTDRPDPMVIYFHGGGFVCGGLDPEHEFCLSLARNSGASVVSVDYRLAPERPFPEPLDDARAALDWAVVHSDRVGGDPARLAVGGSSAGATLAAALCLMVRDSGGPTIALQLLMHPCVDDRLLTDSMRRYEGAPSGHGKASCAFLGSQYLHGVDPEDVSPLAFPARATDLRGLPSAIIGVGQCDPLRDEGVDYAVALMNADVPTELHAFPGTLHCSYLFASADVSNRERRAYAEGVRAALGQP